MRNRAFAIKPHAWGPAWDSQVKGSVEDIFGAETSKQRKRTEEGFVIYHEDELKINEGGDTDLCPFDCQCCF
jgi:hypothetical protein